MIHGDGKLILSTAEITGDEVFTLDVNRSLGNLVFQLDISDEATVLVYGRLSPDAEWVNLTGTTYITTEIDQQAPVPYLRLVWTDNTGTINFWAWGVE